MNINLFQVGESSRFFQDLGDLGARAHDFVCAILLLCHSFLEVFRYICSKATETQRKQPRKNTPMFFDVYFGIAEMWSNLIHPCARFGEVLLCTRRDEPTQAE